MDVEAFKKGVAFNQQWISVEQEVPPHRSLLLTTSKMIVIGDFYCGIWRIDGSVYLRNHQLLSDYKNEDITHWMKLPEVE